MTSSTENTLGDLTGARFQEHAMVLADQFANGIAVDPAIPALVVNLARRLTDSRKDVKALGRPLKVGVVFAMWGEAERLQPKTKNNPLGEDSLATKVRSLEWLFRGTEIEWTLYAVDDGCPDQSGDVAERLRQSMTLGNSVKVLWLAKELPSTRKPFSLLRSVDDSKKGASIALGCLAASDDGCDYIAYTDCDNSVHLGQLGSLLFRAVNGKLDIVFGDRFSKDSDFTWDSARQSAELERKIVAHICRLMIPVELPTADAMSPMKLLRAGCAASLMSDLVVFDFTFDFDLAISAACQNARCETVPYTFFDSYEASAWHAIGTYSVWAGKLSGIAKSVVKNGFPLTETMKRIVDTLADPKTLQMALSQQVPSQASNLRYGFLGDPNVWAPGDILDWLEGLRLESMR